MQLIQRIWYSQKDRQVKRIELSLEPHLIGQLISNSGAKAI